MRWGKWLTPTKERMYAEPTKDSFKLKKRIFRVEAYSTINILGDLSISPERFRLIEWRANKEAPKGFDRRSSRDEWNTEAEARAALMHEVTS